MPHPGRVGYVFLQMPQNTFLAVVILGAGTVLYPHYATTARTWGPTPLEDQQLAAGIMWLVGDADLPRRGHADRVGLDAARDARRAAAWTGGPRSSWPRSADGRRSSPSGAARSAEDAQSGSGAAR